MRLLNTGRLTVALGLVVIGAFLVQSGRLTGDGPRIAQAAEGDVEKSARPCCGEDPPKKEAKANLPPGLYACPVFPFLFHGNYVTYYATVHDTSIPGCATPVSYDGPPNLPSGDCNTGQDCIGPYLTDAKPNLKRSLYNNEAHPDIKSGKISIGDYPSNHPNEGTTIIGTGVNHIEFRIARDPQKPNETELVKAQVVLCHVTVPHRPDLKPLEAGVGQEIVTMSSSDRSEAAGEVRVLSREGRAVKVVVKIKQNEWREFQVVLKN